MIIAVAVYRPEVFVEKTSELYSDDPSVWPLGLSRYYLGRMPDVDGMLPRDLEGMSDVMRGRIASRIHAAWDDASVRLAGRIWGHLARHIRRPE